MAVMQKVSSISDSFLPYIHASWGAKSGAEFRFARAVICKTTLMGGGLIIIIMYLEKGVLMMSKFKAAAVIASPVFSR